MKYQFPKNFKWGSAVWAQGTEGAWDKDGKAPTVFEEYYRLEPTRFYNGVGPYETLNWYEDYDKYAQLAQDISHNSFRTSILWARLFPDGKTVNEEAVKFYRNLFKSFKDRGMDLTVVLYWFDMPVLFEKQGGFTNRDILDPFVHYCHQCFELFSDLVDTFYVYNEPIVDVRFKYDNDMCYPNLLDFNLANKAVYYMVLAHALVVEDFKKGNYPTRIGTVLNHQHVYPRSQAAGDLKAAENHRLLYQTCYEDGLLKGEINQDWLDLVTANGAEIVIEDGDLAVIKDNTINILGLNIYYPTRVKAKEHALHPDAPVRFDSFFDDYVMHGRMMNTDRGWEIFPQGMYDSVMELTTKYNKPEILITENGMGIQDEYRYRDNTGQIQDDYRIEYVKEHLKWLHKSIEDGANVSGYNMWSFIDLWSPSNQFKNCYGFYEYNLDTKESRRKKSADWFKKITEDNGF